MRKTMCLLSSALLLLATALPCPGLQVTEDRSSGTISIEVTRYEAKEIAAEPPAASRLAARVGYRVLILTGIPVSVIGQVVLPRAGTKLMEKYSADILKCARYHDGGFTLTYPVDLETMRDSWNRHAGGEVSKPGSAANTALMDIVTRFENALPRHTCPDR